MSEYSRPETLPEALAILTRDAAVVLAGGTDVYPAARGRAPRGPLLDITGVVALRGIEQGADGGVRIGACVTWAEVIAADLPAAFDGLKTAAREVGGRQIQARGTVAGNLCNASPAADGVPPLLVLDASVELASATGMRVLPLADFLVGPRRTARAPGEIVTAVLVPAAAARGRSAFIKLGARRHLVISIAMVAVRLVVEGARVAEARLAVGACGPVAVRLSEVEASLVDAAADARLAERIAPGAVAAVLAPIDDVRAGAGYRAEAAAVLLSRAVAELAR
jgi:CO/xanthine dehydrogenase FAD-binding subunit